MKFRHIRSNEGTPFATLASQAIEGTELVMFALSRCNPNDAFQKAKGRLISGNRVKKAIGHFEANDDCGFAVLHFGCALDYSGEDEQYALACLLDGTPVLIPQNEISKFIGVVDQLLSDPFYRFSILSR